MNKAEYPIVIHVIPEADGGGYLALAPDLCGCLGDGATPDEAVACLREAMSEWEDEMRRLERPIPEPFSLSDKARDEEIALRKLVDAQSELIKRHEQSLAHQNASLQGLRDQVDALMTGVDLNPGYALLEPSVGSCRAGDKWRDTLMVGVAKCIPLTKRSQIAH